MCKMHEIKTFNDVLISYPLGYSRAMFKKGQGTFSMNLENFTVNHRLYSVKVGVIPKEGWAR